MILADNRLYVFHTLFVSLKQPAWLLQHISCSQIPAAHLIAATAITGGAQPADALVSNKVSRRQKLMLNLACLIATSCELSICPLGKLVGLLT